MNESKMREALEYVQAVYDTFFDDVARGYVTRDKEYAISLLGEALTLSKEALAQSDDVGLTDDEICKALFNNPIKSGMADEFEVQIARARAVIAAHEAKKAKDVQS